MVGESRTYLTLKPRPPSPPACNMTRKPREKETAQSTLCDFTDLAEESARCKRSPVVLRIEASDHNGIF